MPSVKKYLVYENKKNFKIVDILQKHLETKLTKSSCNQIAIEANEKKYVLFFILEMYIIKFY